MTKITHLRTGCPVEISMGILGGRWKCVVLFALLKGTKRFSELERLLPNCTQRMLTLQLRELERNALVKRSVFPEVPPRVEYELTSLGRTLEPILIQLRDWGENYESRFPKRYMT